MPLQATSGTASYDAFGGGVAVEPVYIEQIFQTYLYTGNGSTQTITNGIDLSTKGGLTWIKARNSANEHSLEDTLRTVSIYAATLSSNTTAAQSAGDITGFTTSGFSLRDYTGATNSSGTNYASWTFRKQPKFFDVVTYTGNGTAGRTVAHNLGSVPGCVIVKSTSDATIWAGYHRSLGATKLIRLNTTDAATTNATMWNDTEPTSTVFTVGNAQGTNQSGLTYVAYLFAHDAGGFGLTGTDNVISCGSYTGTGAAGNTVNLGYEPQWLMVKNASAAEADGWVMLDVMRGMPNFFATDQSRYLSANSSNAEQALNLICPTATGFYIDRAGNPLNTNAQTYIYIAIRRGPMKVPTSGTSVFAPLYEAGTGSARTVNAGFPTDLFFIKDSTGLTGPTAGGNVFYDRLRGNSNVLQTQSTAAEAVSGTYTALFNSVQNGVVVSDYWSSYAYREYCFQRAPSFFDEVCYTGNGSSPGQTLNHNLNAVPELIIWKARSNGVNNWYVYNATVGTEFYVELNTTIAKLAFSLTGSRTPTSSVFYTCTGGDSSNNGNNITYVAYLFATCAGVSKVGSYTGTGTTLQVNCGFTGGARFVLIKRTDSTGSWYVWDVARGISSGNDPYLLLNSTAAEVTNTDYIDAYSAGFEISSTAPAEINASGGSFIFLAIS